jgi:hypothetical protein
MSRMASSSLRWSSAWTAASMSRVCAADLLSRPVTTERPASVSRMTCRRPSAADRCRLIRPSDSNLARIRLR